MEANLRRRGSTVVEYTQSHELVSARLESTIEAFEEEEEAGVQQLAAVVNEESKDEILE